MTVLNLFPERIRFVNPDGTLTREASRMLEVLVGRVGGTLGDTGTDVFAAPEPASPGGALDVLQQLPASAAAAELLQQAAAIDASAADLVQQHAPYNAGTALALVDYRFSLKDTPVAPGSYGDASNVAKFTVDQQGRLVLVQSIPISIGAGQVSGLGTMAAQNVGTNFTGSFTGKTVTVSNGIITSVV